MIKIIIADDEFFILERLKKLLSSDTDDFQVIAACTNGKDAMIQIEELRPDIAILDIKMPFLTGLQIAEQIKIRGIHTKIIILTSFELFDFAKQAVEYNVFSYLLKPIKAEELRKTIQEASNQIDTEQQNAEKLQRYDMITVEHSVYLQLSNNGIIDEKLLPDVFNGSRCVLLLLKIGSHDEVYDKFTHVRETIHSLTDAGNYCFTVISENVAAIVTKEEVLYDGFTIKLQRELCQKLKTTISIAISEGKSSWSDLSLIYEITLRRLYHSLFESENTIISPQKQIKNYARCNYNLYNMLCPFFNKRDEDGAITKIHSCFENLRQSPSIYNLEVLISELFVTCSAFEKDSSPIEQTSLFYRVHLLLEGMSTIDDVEQWCCQYLKRHFGTSYKQSEGELTTSVRYLVQECYADSELNLPYISEKLGYTTNYISSVFKKETGISVVQYITEQRMVAAKRLLSSGKYTVNTVCEMVGYSNPFYFSKRYKEYYGYAPSDVKKSSTI